MRKEYKTIREVAGPLMLVDQVEGVKYHSWIFIQSEETLDANSELFKENVDDTMYKNPYEI